MSMWSQREYELTGVYEEGGKPMKVEGATAAVMRSLDAFDPLGPDERNTMTWGQTIAEFENYLGDFHWCAPLGRAVVRSGRDMYRLAEAGEVVAWAQEFLAGRVVWANDAMRRAKAEDGDLKGAMAYAKAASKQDAPSMAGRLADAVKASLTIDPERLDNMPSVIGTPYGVVELWSGDMTADNDDWDECEGAYVPEPTALRAMVTKSTRGHLNSTSPNAEDDQWLDVDERWGQFVLEVMDGDAEKAAFLKRALGYSLYGGNPEKATFVLWGPSRDNGKSTLMNAVKHCLGDYADTAPAALLLVKRAEDHTKADPVVAKLRGARLVDVSEPPKGARLDASMVKKLASGTDEICTRFLHKDEFSYVPQFTVWMHCNALPKVNDRTALNPRHMFVVEFPKSFSGTACDMSLSERFQTPKGMHTVFKWMVEGYLEYRERGLDAPESVKRATETWLGASGSWVERFLEERCAVGRELSTPVSEFKEAARQYCEDCDEVFVLGEMKECLKEAGILCKRTTGGLHGYQGVSVLPSWESESVGTNGSGGSAGHSPKIRLE